MCGGAAVKPRRGGAAGELVLPASYVDAKGALLPFTHAGRATLAMVWMATWWMLPILAALAPALGVAPAILLVPARWRRARVDDARRHAAERVMISMCSSSIVTFCDR